MAPTTSLRKRSCDGSSIISSRAFLERDQASRGVICCLRARSPKTQTSQEVPDHCVNFENVGR